MIIISTIIMATYTYDFETDTVTFSNVYRLTDIKWPSAKNYVFGNNYMDLKGYGNIPDFVESVRLGDKMHDVDRLYFPPTLKVLMNAVDGCHIPESVEKLEYSGITFSDSELPPKLKILKFTYYDLESELTKLPDTLEHLAGYPHSLKKLYVPKTIKHISIKESSNLMDNLHDYKLESLVIDELSEALENLPPTLKKLYIRNTDSNIIYLSKSIIPESCEIMWI